MLPFLVKVLAADEPLSLQAHPSAEQAVEGYLREERMGIPVSSPVRNYRDTSHKPELLVALQPFEALAGFREAARTTELLRALAVSDLDPFIDLLSEGSDADGLRALFTTWITAPQPDIDVLVPAVLDGAIQYVSSGATEFGAEAKTVLELGERYPGDAGVLAALLLNRISLAPGEAIFLPAGNLHAYVRGFGVEVMANSDNVLRGGLTLSTSMCPSCCGCWTSPPRRRLGCGPRSGARGWGWSLRRPPMSSRPRYWCSTAITSATRSTRRPAMTVHRSCYAPRVRRRCTGSAGRSRYSAARPPGWRPTTARSG